MYTHTHTHTHTAHTHTALQKHTMRHYLLRVMSRLSTFGRKGEKVGLCRGRSWTAGPAKPQPTRWGALEWKFPDRGISGWSGMPRLFYSHLVQSSNVCHQRNASSWVRWLSWSRPRRSWAASPSLKGDLGWASLCSPSSTRFIWVRSSLNHVVGFSFLRRNLEKGSQWSQPQHLPLRLVSELQLILTFFFSTV